MRLLDESNRIIRQGREFSLTALTPDLKAHGMHAKALRNTLVLAGISISL